MTTSSQKSSDTLVSRLLDWAVPPVTHSSANELRERVALFMRSFAAYVLFFEVITIPMDLHMGQPLMARPERIVQWCVVLLLFVCAAVLDRSHLPQRPTRIIDITTTVGIATVQSITNVHWIGTYVIMVIFIVTLVLTFRAAMVPSSTVTTFFVGVMAFAPLNAVLFVSRQDVIWQQPHEALNLPWKLVAPMLMLAGVVCTAVVSRVIFGLQRTVQEARALGQYELLRKLGGGGMGEVYEARHRLLRRPTAVKVVRPERVGEATLKRFELEVVETAKLSHPNTIAIYDYGRADDGTFYYAMEFLNGMTLQELVKGHGPMPVGRVVPALMQAAGALHEAHERGLVHRDIKPANIMLTERGGVPDVVKVLDFGLVKDLDTHDDPELTAAGAMLGTPAYMAPEMHTRPTEVDRRADIYAFGAVAFYLLTGHLVFEAASVAGVISAHLRDAPPPPSTLSAGIPAALDAIVVRCLAKEPEDRFQSTAEIAAALRDIDLTAFDAGWCEQSACAWWHEHAPEGVGTSQCTRDGLEPLIGTVTRFDPENDVLMADIRDAASEPDRG